METHFVWVYVKFSQKADEIKHSIRSVEKFFLGERKIFIVGDKPDNFKPYWTHIPHKQVMNLGFAKVMDSISKLQTIVQEDQINPDFVYMYDDQVFLRPFSLGEISMSVANDHVDSLINYWKPTGTLPSKTWREQFRITIDKLKKNGKGTWNYETHTPRLLNKALITEVIETYIEPGSLSTQPVLFATLYGNHVRLNPDISLDRNDSYKCGIYHAKDINLIRKDTLNKLVLNYNDNGWDNRLETFIKERLKA